MDTPGVDRWIHHNGSPFLLAPEMVKSHGYHLEVGAWQAGVLSHFLLLGTVPFEANTCKQPDMALPACSLILVVDLTCVNPSGSKSATRSGWHHAGATRQCAMLHYVALYLQGPCRAFSTLDYIPTCTSIQGVLSPHLIVFLHAQSSRLWPLCSFEVHRTLS